MVRDWNSYQLPALLAEFSPNEVFNADETGLFWKCLPDKTMSVKGEKCSGGKKSKERITVLVCANMSGSEKLPLLVIGRFAKPRCFKNARSIPVQYEANSKAWMVSDLFSSWLTKLDAKFVREKRKVAMVVDNCPAHPNIQCNLRAIKLVFLPPNTTSKSQPCDQGIIQNLKVHYRKNLIMQLIASIEGNREFNFNLLDALYLLRLSWNSVSPSTISRCFKHCGFVSPVEDNPGDPTDSIDSNPDTDMSETGELLAKVNTSVSVEDYVSVDQEAITSEYLSDDAIIDSVVQAGPSSSTVSEQDSTDSEEPHPIVPFREVQEAVYTIRTFMEQQHGADFDLIVKLDDHVKTYSRNLRQSLITDYVYIM